MSNTQLKTEYQKYTIERLLELRASRPELSSEARKAIEEELASRPGYVAGIVEECERRGDAYRRTTRQLKSVVLLGVLPLLPAAALLLPERFANYGIVILLLAFAALFLLDVWYQRRMLICPNCGRFPLLDVGYPYYGSTLAALRCAFCGKFLGPGGLGRRHKRSLGDGCNVAR